MKIEIKSGGTEISIQENASTEKEVFSVITRAIEVFDTIYDKTKSSFDEKQYYKDMFKEQTDEI